MGKILSRALKNKTSEHCLSIENQMKLLRECQMVHSAFEFQPLCVQLQLANAEQGISWHGAWP
jgi:hypothetical protein